VNSTARREFHVYVDRVDAKAFSTNSLSSPSPYSSSYVSLLYISLPAFSLFTILSHLLNSISPVIWHSLPFPLPSIFEMFLPRACVYRFAQSSFLITSRTYALSAIQRVFLSFPFLFHNMLFLPLIIRCMSYSNGFSFVFCLPSNVIFQQL